MDPIELFLLNALREKALEDRLIRQAVRDLRQVLRQIEQTIISSGTLGLIADRNAAIQAVTSAVARAVQESWGIPQLGALQAAMEPYIAQQMDYARKLVDAAGGTIVAPGAASANAANVVNNVVVNGKTVSQQLTAAFPAMVADRVERYIRLGLNPANGQVLETLTYDDAVVTITERNVQALIRTAVHETGGVAQQLIYEYEADPDWLQDSFTWTAILDSAVCPICVALDGKEYKRDVPGPYFDGTNKISPHMQCRCYLLPSSWRNEDDVAPSGEKVAVKRPATGDQGETVIKFKDAARTWVKQNPDTARAIFGKRLGNRLLRGEIGFDRAVKEWQAPRKAT